MANRTNIADVKVIIDTELVDDDITSMITSANLIITALLGSEGLSVSLLTEIEKWFTAHLISSSRERQTQREEIGGDTNEEYAKLGKGLEGTTYGQMVMTLDTSGKMAATYKTKASITAVVSFSD